jgi:hypothetical protein
LSSVLCNLNVLGLRNEHVPSHLAPTTIWNYLNDTQSLPVRPHPIQPKSSLFSTQDGPEQPQDTNVEGCPSQKHRFEEDLHIQHANHMQKHKQKKHSKTTHNKQQTQHTQLQTNTTKQQKTQTNTQNIKNTKTT